MEIVYAFNPKHDQNVRHITVDGMGTLCGKYAASDRKPSGLPADCGECRTEYRRVMGPPDGLVAPQSGYTPCACRDCMDITVSSDTTKPELCTECTDAGCSPWRDGQEPKLYDGVFYECQRDDAYDAAAEEEGCTCDYLRAQYDPTYRQCAFCVALEER